MRNIFDHLESEWHRLRHDRVAARRLAGVCARAGDATCLADVEAYVRGADAADADQVLAALAAVVAHDSHPTRRDLAARVLLQLLLPGTRNLARRWWALGDHDERAAAAVAAVYRRIRYHPLDRRPARIAANVLMDAAQDLRRAVPRVITTPLADPTTVAPQPVQAPPNAAVELGDVLTDAVSTGIITRQDAQLIARSRIAGHRIAELADHQGLRPRTLWDRRQRAERALAATHR